MKLDSTKIKWLATSGLIGISVITMATGSLALADNPIPAIPVVGPGTVGGLVDLIRGIVRWIYIIFFIVAVALILFAAFTYLTAAGDEEKVKKAKNMIIYAVIAIVIAFLAVSFSTIIGTFLNTPSA